MSQIHLNLGQDTFYYYDYFTTLSMMIIYLEAKYSPLTLVSG